MPPGTHGPDTISKAQPNQIIWNPGEFTASIKIIEPASSGPEFETGPPGLNFFAPRFCRQAIRDF